jgi:hypothetical protein
MSTENDILNNINKNNSAEELNKNSQFIYVYDLVYVICKIFLFVILGIIYVVFFKNINTMKNAIVVAKDNLISAKDDIAQKIKLKVVKDTNKTTNTNKQPNP